MIGGRQDPRVDPAEVALGSDEEDEKPDGQDDVHDGPGRGDRVLARTSGLGPTRPDDARTKPSQEDPQRDQVERDEAAEERLDVQQNPDSQE